MKEDVTTGPASSSRFMVRLLSALVMAPLSIAIIYFGGWPFYGLIALAFVLSLYEFFGLARQGKHKAAHLLFGILYFSVCIGAFAFIRVSFEQGMLLAFTLMFSVWASDIGAYLYGKTFKGPKMTPKLSPNKTWAGLVGAMICSGLVMFLMFYQFSLSAPELWLKVFGFGFLLGAVGQTGDLLMSFYKRRVGAKDTGQLIPGHGGLLDRIDAFLLVSPVFYMFLKVGL